MLRRKPEGHVRAACDALERRLLLATYTGVVYHDHDGDGTRDAADEGIANRRVYADLNDDGNWDSSGRDAEPSDLTDAAGAWGITFTPAAGFKVRHVVAIRGERATAPAGGFVQYFNIGGAFRPAIDPFFGIAFDASISGVVFHDINGNRARGAAEPGIQGRQVFLDEDRDEVFDAGEPTRTTDAAGEFSFTGLAPGNYKVVQVVPPEPWHDTTGLWYAPTLTSGEHWVQDFGTAQFGAVWGNSYEDVNGNGLRDPGEPRLEGQYYYDRHNNAAFDSAFDYIATASNGGYFLPKRLPAGAAMIRPVLSSLPGYVATAPAAQGRVVIVLSDQVVENIDFGWSRPAGVQGRVFHDADADGVQDAGETGLAGRTVYLDVNGNGVHDAYTRTFPSISPRTFGDIPLPVFGTGGRIVDVNLRTDFYTSGNGSKSLEILAPDGTPVTLYSGSAVAEAVRAILFDDEAAAPFDIETAIDGRSYRPTSPLSAFDGRGADGDWILRTVSSSAHEWSLVLTIEEPFAVSSADGSYNVTGVAAGPYVVRMAPVPLWRQTAPPADAAQQRALRSGQSVAGPDFGQTQLSLITGKVFADADGDGVPDDGEAGLPGSTIFLDQNDDGVVNSAVSTAASADVPRPLTDNSMTASALSVAGLVGFVFDLDVRLDVTHPFDEDLDVVLVSPSGRRVALFNDVGSNGDHFTGTVLDDEAAAAIATGAAPFAGRFRPAQPLSAFDGQDPNGAWTLEVTDDSMGFTGTLNAWSLTIAHGEHRTVSDAGGTYQFLGLPPSRYIVRQVPRAGWGRGAAPPAGYYDLPVGTGAEFRGTDFANVRLPTAVAGRWVFYHRDDPDASVAADKQALLPGQSASSTNVTPHFQGITGVMIDVALLPPASVPTADDFELHAGDGSTWRAVPSAPDVRVRPGAGASGADRITLTLPDATARNTWLRVTVKANGNTGLAVPDVFYFGNLPGDAGGPGTPAVNTLDLARVRANVGNTSAAALATCDFNRDGRVNAADVLITRANLGRALPPITAAAGAGAAAARGEVATSPTRLPTPARRGVWESLQPAVATA